MHTDEFEKKFEELLEKDCYDAASAALFSLAREAYDAGYAAGRDSILSVAKVISISKSSQKTSEG